MKKAISLLLLCLVAARVFAQKSVPTEVQQWINEELTKVKDKKPIDYNSNDFFRRENARLIGYLKGYDPRLGFNTGLIYARNELTREDFPTVVNIHPDGRFEADVPIQYPMRIPMKLKKVTFDIYLEPGNTLYMFLDWEDFLALERDIMAEYDYNNVEFEGPLAGINKGMITLKLGETYCYDIAELDSLSPEKYKDRFLKLYEDNKEIIRQKAEENAMVSQSMKILDYTALIYSGFNLMDYTSTKKYKEIKESISSDQEKILPEDYYDFLRQIPLNDQALLITPEFSSFINQLEFYESFEEVEEALKQMSKPQKSYLQYLIEDEGADMTEDDREIVDYITSINGKPLNEEEVKEYKKKEDRIEAFYEKNRSKYKDYAEKYVSTLNEASLYKREWAMKDSIYKNELKLAPSLAYEIVKTRELKDRIRRCETKECGQQILDIYTSMVTHPFLKEEAKHLFTLAFPEVKGTSYNLPDTEAAKIFKSIIDKFKGKYIMVTFWNVSEFYSMQHALEESKELREKYKDHADIAFVFVTNTSESPLDRYNKLVEEYNITHSYRLNDDDFNRLVELFKFSRVSHYETIDKEGKVMFNSLHYYTLDFSLPRLLKQK